MKLELLESRRLLAHSAASLSGTWPLIGGAGNGYVTWDAGGGTFSGQNVKVITNNLTTFSGTYAVAGSGAVNLTVYSPNDSGPPDTSAATGAIAVGGSVLVLSDVLPAGDTTDNGLLLVAVKSADSYAQSDLAGTWMAVREHLRLTLHIAADGSTTGTYVSVDHPSPTALAAGCTATLAPDGTVTLALRVPDGSKTFIVAGHLAASKDAFSFITSNPASDDTKTSDEVQTGLALRLHPGTTKSQVFGTYAIRFQGGSGSITFDGKGKIASGTAVSPDGTFALSGTYSVGADGSVSGVTIAVGTNSRKVFPFAGAISPDASIIAINDVRFSKNPNADDLGTVFDVSSAVQTPPAVTISAVSASVAEGAPAQFTVTRAIGALDADLTVNISVAGTAKKNRDFNPASVPTSVVIPSGQPSAIFSVATIDDSTVDGPRTITAVAKPSALYTIANAKPVAVTLLDNEPVLSITASDPVATRPSAHAELDTATFTLSRGDADASNDLAVHLLFSGAKAGTDFEQLLATVVIAAGQDHLDVTLNPLASAKVKKAVKLTVTLAKGGYVLPTAKDQQKVVITLNPSALTP